MSLPNWISLGRVLLVPVFLYFSYAEGDAAAIAAVVVFFVASVSDFVDGYLARRNGTITPLGQFLDPLADKLLVGAALFVLVDTRDFPLWAALVIGGREVLVQILRIAVVRAGGSMPASSAAKAKTAMQIAMVSVWLLPLEVTLFHQLLVAAALATTLWSGFEYFIRVKVHPPKEAVG
jgi:CDP-diacylglycerol--glycerol-3-phosphate 3-phosphatidyltransferase